MKPRKGDGMTWIGRIHPTQAGQKTGVRLLNHRFLQLQLIPKAFHPPNPAIAAFGSGIVHVSR